MKSIIVIRGIHACFKCGFNFGKVGIKMENKLTQLMHNLPKNIDCGLVTSAVNRRYLTGFSSSAGVLVVTREKSYFIVDFRYYERAAGSIQDCDVILLEDSRSQLESILRKHNCKNIAVEAYAMSLFEYNHYCETFPDYHFTSSAFFQDLIDGLRAIKTPHEIEKIKEAQKITDEAFSHILSFITEGQTERQIAAEINRFIRQNEAELSFDTIVVSGRNSSSPHGVPSDKPIEEGDFITMDFGAMLDGYHSDMTRTIVVGQPSEEQIMVYKNVYIGQNLALDYIKSGQQGMESDRLVREYFDSQGYQGAFGHGLGHGVGLEIHEKPHLGKNAAAVLRSGMVVTIEPGLYLPGKFGVRIEDMVVITDNGCENLTNSRKDLICL